MIEVDVLIVGGGPAGLLAATYLSRRHRVALIERGVFGHTTKYWVTTAQRLAKHGLDDFVLFRSEGMSIGTYLGGKATGSGSLVVVDDGRLLNELTSRCRKRGVLLTENSPLMNLSWSKYRLRAESANNTYSARLVVDATGVASPIAATFRLHRLDGFFSVFGGHLQPITLGAQEVVLAYVNQLGQPPPILEVIPTGHNSAYCALLCYSRELVSPSSLEAKFRENCGRNPFFSMHSETRLDRLKSGAIAIGSRRGRKLPGIFSLGDAALVQPPLLGTSFNELLEYCDVICDHLAHRLDQSDDLPKCDFRYPLLKRMQDRLQLAIARVLLRTDIQVFDRLVRVMSRMPQDVFFRFCSNELSWSEVASTAALLSRSLLTKSTVEGSRMV